MTREERPAPFTVALFIAELAFGEHRIVDEAKIGVLLASFAAALLGWTLMRWSGD